MSCKFTHLFRIELNKTQQTRVLIANNQNNHLLYHDQI